MSMQMKLEPLSKLESMAAQQEAERVIQQHSRTFYFATSLLPRQSKRAVRALYAFCRTTDDLVDRLDATPLQLESWRQQVNLPIAEQTNAVLYIWANIRDQYQVNRQYEQELIDGVRMDLEKHSYQTWEDLQLYCYCVASTVGLMSMPMIGTASGVDTREAEPYAVKLGIALQMVNILRDIGEDLQRNRIYIPQEDLTAFGLENEDLHAHLLDDRFKNLMRFQIDRTRKLFREALPGIALLNPKVRSAVAAAALLYQAILGEIERNQYQVYKTRAYVPAWKKVMMLPGILWQTSQLKPPASTL